MYPVGFSTIIPFDLENWGPALSPALRGCRPGYLRTVCGVWSPQGQGDVLSQTLSTAFLKTFYYTGPRNSMLDLLRPTSGSHTTSFFKTWSSMYYTPQPDEWLLAQVWTNLNKAGWVVPCLCVGSEKPSAGIEKKSRSGISNSRIGETDLASRVGRSLLQTLTLRFLLFVL